MAHLPTPTDVLSLVGIFATGYGGAQVINWALHRRSEQAGARADLAQADAAEVRADVDREDLIAKLIGRADEGQRQIETLRAEIADLRTQHASEIAALQAQHTAELNAQTLIIGQQTTEIQGLKNQQQILEAALGAWRQSAEKGREALSQTLLAAATLPKAGSVSDGGEE